MELTIGNIDPNQDVVIVGFDMLTQLERSFLPDEYDTVDLFTDDPFELPEFRILDSTTAIVDAVINSVSVKNAENVAIVLDQNSEYSPLVESALKPLAFRSLEAQDSVTSRSTERFCSYFGRHFVGLRLSLRRYVRCLRRSISTSTLHTRKNGCIRQRPPNLSG